MERGHWSRLRADDGARKAARATVVERAGRRAPPARRRAAENTQPDFPASPLHAQYLCVPPESCPRWLPPLKAC